ncbi:FecR family protein [Caulobacter sp. 1776]|uniref:FecR family protein n=1 Tax=Caulobacter sp. 1776 TaxID=3156420 RepID=UPI00339A1757
MIRAVLTLADVRGLSPAQAAARWMACEDLTQPPERDQFQQWLDSSPDNQAAWHAVQRMWDAFDDAEDNDLIAALGRAARQAGPAPARSYWPPVIAASLAVAVVSTMLLVGFQAGWFSQGMRPPAGDRVQASPLQVASGADYTTGPGQRSIVDLPDGSRLTLDADSAIDVVFTGKTREVRLLRGHAFFDVAHDPAHPFSVDADSRIVTALGTQFDVLLSAGAMRVVLAQGSVSVRNASGDASMIKLRPGEAFEAKSRATGKVSTIDLDDALAWKQGVVEFQDEPLATVVAKLNRYTRAQIVIKDPRVASMRITGLFRTGDIGRFGRSVSQVLPVKLVARDANTFELVASKR